MTRPLLSLRATDSADSEVVFTALRAALSGDGPAILPAAGMNSGGRPRGTGLFTEFSLPAEVPRRVALVVETSGSSGAPKRVMLSANALLASAAASDSALGGPGQWLLALPLHYIAGLNVLVRSIAADSSPVVLAGGTFTAERFIQTAAGMDRTLRHYTSVVPVQLARLVSAAEAESATAAALRRFDGILVGGQSTPPALLARAVALGLALTRSYGSSETAGGCVYDGRMLQGVAARIRDGQIELSGAILAEGYLGDAQRTTASFVIDEGGERWYRTGDGGELLVDGTLSIIGRLDRVIISGGIKVSLDAVERVLGELPGLCDAVALSQPDPEWGERIVVVGAVAAAATYETATEIEAAATAAVSHTAATLETVSAALVTALGRAAAPARFVVVPQIPRLASGKPDRLAVRALISG
ncbi:MAG: AMP-binding protein [Microbacteriaceae bacterium]|nr:AMP-binding protein [Microbacteriaceae bacterium]